MADHGDAIGRDPVCGLNRRRAADQRLPMLTSVTLQAATDGDADSLATLRAHAMQPGRQELLSRCVSRW